MSNHWPECVAYKGEACPRRCTNCPDPELNGKEHHWMLDYGEINEKDEPEFPEGRYVCRHCEATRDIPDNDDFVEAFPV